MKDVWAVDEKRRKVGSKVQLQFTLFASFGLVGTTQRRPYTNATDARPSPAKVIGSPPSSLSENRDASKHARGGQGYEIPKLLATSLTKQRTVQKQK